MRWMGNHCIIAGLVLAVAAPFGSQAQVDPKLVDSWAFVQKTMPGVPYSLLEAACKEGTVMIYAGTYKTAQDAQIDGFKKRFPCVNVGMFMATTGQRRERFLAETRAGRHIVDIVQDTDPGTLNAQAAQGLLLQYKISNDWAFEEGVKNTGYWYPLRIGLVGIAWNTDLVTEEEAKILADWKGIANPVWKGRAGVIDPAAGGVAYLPWYAWTKLYGPEFLHEVGKNQPRIMSGSSPTSAALAAGDIAVYFNASETGLLPLLNRGAPIRWSLPSPGIGPLTGQGISANAPHPNAAKLYHEYAFTDEGYGLWQREGGAPVRIGFKDLRPVASEKWYKLPDKMFAYDPADATNATKRIVEEFHKAVGTLK